MTDKSQSIAAATGPHRQTGDNEGNTDTTRKPSLLQRIWAIFSPKALNLRDDLAEALEETNEIGPDSFSANERIILQNVLKLGAMRVDDVMVPRAEIEAVDVNDSIAVLIEAFHKAGHSRLPVYAENLDNVLGFVHIKDALQRLTELTTTGTNGSKETKVKMLSPVLRQKIGNKDLVRKLIFVPPSMPVGELLQQMQATRVHMAMVIDEYGGTDGLVTIEDLLEAVVGDIEDEHDDDETLIRKLDDDIFVADARVELSELQSFIGKGFNPGAHADEADTLGGLIFHLIDRVPVSGEVITRFKGFEFEILQADPRRIKRVRISKRKRTTRARVAKPAAAAAATEANAE